MKLFLFWLGLLFMYFINPLTGSMFRRMVQVVRCWEKFAAPRREYFIIFCQYSRKKSSNVRVGCVEWGRVRIADHPPLKKWVPRSRGGGVRPRPNCKL